MPELSLDWVQVVALLGALQGLLLTAVLVTRRLNRTANRILAALVLAFTLYLVSAVYISARLDRVFPHFFGVAYPLPFLFGPLLYLYALTASDRSRGLRLQDLLHAVPFVLAVVAGLPIYLQSGAAKSVFLDALVRGEQPLLLRVVDPLKMVSGVTYAALTLLFLRRHVQRVKDSYSHLERVNLRWLLWLGVSGASIWLLAAVLELLHDVGGFQLAWQDDAVNLAVTVVVYAIGYAGLHQPEVFRFAASDVVAPGSDVEPARYDRSGLSDWEAAAVKRKLLDVMETRSPWRDSELTLAGLAALFSSTPHKVSEVLNSHLGQTFYDFVNGRAQCSSAWPARGPPQAVTLAMDALRVEVHQRNSRHPDRPSAYRRAASQ
jgi:hypothetical protein